MVWVEGALSSRRAAESDSAAFVPKLSSDAFMATLERMKTTNSCSGRSATTADVTQCKQFVAKHSQNGEIPLSKAAMCLLEEVKPAE